MPGNTQPSRFVVVRDRALRKQLWAVASGQAQVTDASLLVILTTNLSA